MPNLFTPPMAVELQSRHAPFDILRRAMSRRLSCNAALWRAIGIGLGFAVIGLAMMALAISAAGVAGSAQPPQDDALALAHSAPASHLEIYRAAGNPLASTMPVP